MGVPRNWFFVWFFVCFDSASVCFWVFVVGFQRRYVILHKCGCRTVLHLGAPVGFEKCETTSPNLSIQPQSTTQSLQQRGLHHLNKHAVSEPEVSTSSIAYTAGPAIAFGLDRVVSSQVRRPSTTGVLYEVPGNGTRYDVPSLRSSTAASIIVRRVHVPVYCGK